MSRRNWFVRKLFSMRFFSSSKSENQHFPESHIKRIGGPISHLIILQEKEIHNIDH